MPGQWSEGREGIHQTKGGQQQARVTGKDTVGSEERAWLEGRQGGEGKGKGEAVSKAKVGEVLSPNPVSSQ